MKRKLTEQQHAALAAIHDGAGEAPFIDLFYMLSIMPTSFSDGFLSITKYNDRWMVKYGASCSISTELIDALFSFYCRTVGIRHALDAIRINEHFCTLLIECGIPKHRATRIYHAAMCKFNTLGDIFRYGKQNFSRLRNIGEGSANALDRWFYTQYNIEWE